MKRFEEKIVLITGAVLESARASLVAFAKKAPS